MPRANRHFLPGYVWHLTHRCHKGEFLLKFARDRRRWMKWLFEARKRYGLAVLNYVVTCNHIHLLVYAGRDGLSVPQSLQLIAGRVGQEFNLRKNRTGAFWEDRYHATAVEGGQHLRRCMTYIDLNMVRAGAFSHPGHWECAGYNEIQEPPERYARIDRALLARLLELPHSEEVARWQKEVITDELADSSVSERRLEWSESIAVGSEDYLRELQAGLGIDGHHRTIDRQSDEAYILREQSPAYDCNNTGEIEALRGDNAVPWRLSY